ncbi:MAG: M55 family metallopeptidase [Gemmatimonadales bacterium]|nr:M55 family metallopeptidase [Gemmatimonadales bacterium]
MRINSFAALVALGAAALAAPLGARPLAAQNPAAPQPTAQQAAAQQARLDLFRGKRLPAQAGFRVMIVPDMEGMGSVVDIHEVIAGNEGERYKTLTSVDYWDHFRQLLTKEVNATIAGARAGGAASFVVNEGHGGNMFANVLPWDLDTSAMLVRGFPKPLVMITGLDSTFKTLMFTGAHANAGSPGVMAHSFAFDSFTVNGTRLNEVGINALIAGEMGVSVSLVSGDDVLIAETQEMLGKGFVPIVTKRAVGRMAAITYSPARVRRLLQQGAAEAVRREMRGEIKPFTLSRPYRVDFTMRSSYPDSTITAVSKLAEFKLEKLGSRSFRLVTDSARQMGYLLDAIEQVVLR